MSKAKDDLEKYFFPVYYYTKNTRLGVLTNPANLWVQSIKTLLNSAIGLFIVYTLFVLISLMPIIMDSTGKHLSIIVLAFLMVWMLLRIALSWVRFFYAFGQKKLIKS